MSNFICISIYGSIFINMDFNQTIIDTICYRKFLLVCLLCLNFLTHLISGWTELTLFFPYSTECQNYQVLSSADRNINYHTTSAACDSGLSGWYRFQGAVGTRMATSCPSTHRCNTDATGWLNGGHPTVAEGRTTKTVCFHWHNNCCYYDTNIQVRNCGSFYVYSFSGTPSCSLGYCGTY